MNKDQAVRIRQDEAFGNGEGRWSNFQCHIMIEHSSVRKAQGTGQERARGNDFNLA